MTFYCSDCGKDKQTVTSVTPLIAPYGSGYWLVLVFHGYGTVIRDATQDLMSVLEAKLSWGGV